MPFSSPVVTGAAGSVHLLDPVVAIEEMRNLKFMAQTLLARTGLERVPLEFLGAGYLLSYATAVSAAKR